MLQPGDTIGILGGGQLGRMLALAAAKLGLKTHIYCPDPQSPAFDVTPYRTIAEYEDEKALESFAKSVSLVTYEFENIPAKAITYLKTRLPVLPDDIALETSQDRLTEKRFFNANGIASAGFAEINEPADLEKAAEKLGLPAIIKTRRFGYDGKGQILLKSREDYPSALKALKNAPSILESFVPFEKEISVIVARNAKGEVAVYDIAENVHKNHILDTTTIPAKIDEETEIAARKIGKTIAQSLNYVGVLAVELFVLPQASPTRLVANEMAPRVHNSGHWTESACLISQFEQHIRAIANWPLGDTRRHSDVVMTNLIGQDCQSWEHYLAESATTLHNYGKAETRQGRKMGHINRCEPIKD